MTDLSATIAPKSDQLNADDMIAGPMTIRITKVTEGASKEQPIKIFFENDDGKPYLPCKSMRRLLVQIWGKNGADYVGREMTLYRDPTVKFGGEAVGGIRISHMSNIDKPVTLALTVTRASRKPYTVEPLAPSKPARAVKSIADRVATFRSMLKTADTEQGVEDLRAKAAKLFDEVDAETKEALDLEVDARITDVKALAEHRAKEQR